LVPSFDGSDDGVWVSGPTEGPRIGIGLGEEAINGGLQLDDGAEYAAFEPPLGQLGKETFDSIEP
jgi:hypothetical protein